MQFGAKLFFFSVWILTCFWLFIITWSFSPFASTGFYCPLQTSPSTLAFVEFPNVWRSAGLLFEPSVTVVVEHCLLLRDGPVSFVCMCLLRFPQLCSMPWANIQEASHEGQSLCLQLRLTEPFLPLRVILSPTYQPAYLPGSLVSVSVPLKTSKDSQEILNPFKGDSHVLFVNKCGPAQLASGIINRHMPVTCGFNI